MPCSRGRAGSPQLLQPSPVFRRSVTQETPILDGRCQGPPFLGCSAPGLLACAIKGTAAPSICCLCCPGSRPAQPCLSCQVGERPALPARHPVPPVLPPPPPKGLQQAPAPGALQGGSSRQSGGVEDNIPLPSSLRWGTAASPWPFSSLSPAMAQLPPGWRRLPTCRGTILAPGHRSSKPTGWPVHPVGVGWHSAMLEQARPPLHATTRCFSVHCEVLSRELACTHVHGAEHCRDLACIRVHGAKHTCTCVCMAKPGADLATCACMLLSTVKP